MVGMKAIAEKAEEGLGLLRQIVRLLKEIKKILENRYFMISLCMLSGNFLFSGNLK